MGITRLRVNTHFNLQQDLPFIVPLLLLSWWLAFSFQDPFIIDWDGYDYTVDTVRGLPSVLGLGRALFIGYNHLLWQLLNEAGLLVPENAHLLLKFGSILLSGPATAGIYALTKELTFNRWSSLWAGLIFGLSPYYITYSGRPMSEIPGFFLLTWSLWLLLRTLRSGKFLPFIATAALIGLSVNVREIGLFYIPFICLAAREEGWKPRIPLLAMLVTLLMSLSGFAFWTLQRGYLYLNQVMAWYRLSSVEREFHPVTIKNIEFVGEYAYNCSVVVVFLTPLAITLLLPQRRYRALLWLGLLGLLADIVLLINHDLSVNPRYLLLGMVGLAPICGWTIVELYRCFRWRAVTLVASIWLLSFTNFVERSIDIYWQEHHSRAAAEYLIMIKNFPWNSGFIVGARSPLVNFYAGIEARPFWKTISPGAGWPDDKLEEKIDDMLIAGRPVFVDFDPEIWQHGARGHSREAAGLNHISELFELEPITKTMFRIKSRRSTTNSKEKN